MATTGHENELVKVEGLKASLQKYKTDISDKKLDASLKGKANGVAELDSNGKVPSAQLPSFVDDVIEGYLYNGKFYTDATHTTEVTGEGGKIYTDLASNKTYRWGGSGYSQIKGDVVIGTTTGTAADGKVVNDHIVNTTVHVTAAERTAWNAKGSYSKPSGGIPETDLATAVQNALTKAEAIPDNPKYTDTDTKVTSADNHYTPAADSKSEITATAGTAGAYNKDTEYTVVTGVKLQRDAKGHVTGASLTTQKVKDTNTTYSAGTSAQLTAGTDTVNRVWQAKTLHDYVNGLGFLTSHQDISGKVDKVSGKGLSTYDYDATAKAKVDAIPDSPKYTDNDTKNTAGTTNKTNTKMFLVSATSQGDNPQTYSNSNCYIGMDNKLYSGGAVVLTGTVASVTTCEDIVSELS